MSSGVKKLYFFIKRYDTMSIQEENKAGSASICRFMDISDKPAFLFFPGATVIHSVQRNLFFCIACCSAITQYNGDVYRKRHPARTLAQETSVIGFVLKTLEDILCGVV